MHVILGFLATVVTILWLLYRLAEMGIDLGGLNPFLWQRRKKWVKHHDANPVFKITSPMEVTALLITATAKADGDMSAEERDAILSMFENEFHLSREGAAALLTSSSHLLGTGEEVRNGLNNVLAPSLENFSGEQASSAVELLRKISTISGPITVSQDQLISNASSILQQVTAPKGKWQ